MIQLRRQRRQGMFAGAVVAFLLLLFAGELLAHAAGGHDEGTAPLAEPAPCLYCLSFGSLAGPPEALRTVAPAAAGEAPAVRFVAAPAARRLPRPANPRAPPAV